MLYSHGGISLDFGVVEVTFRPYQKLVQSVLGPTQLGHEDSRRDALEDARLNLAQEPRAQRLLLGVGGPPGITRPAEDDLGDLLEADSAHPGRVPWHVVPAHADRGQGAVDLILDHFQGGALDAAVLGGLQVQVLHLEPAAWPQRVEGLAENFLGPLEARRARAPVNIVKRPREQPFVLGVVDLELAVLRHTSSWVCQCFFSFIFFFFRGFGTCLGLAYYSGCIGDRSVPITTAVGYASAVQLSAKIGRMLLKGAMCYRNPLPRSLNQLRYQGHSEVTALSVLGEDCHQE